MKHMEENQFSENKTCEKCHGTGRVKEKDGSVHTCWKCLQEGKLGEHTKDIKDYGIRL